MKFFIRRKKMSENNVLIQMKDLTRTFEDDGTTIVKDFSLDVNRGEFVTFLGPSGCGKTTILRMLGGFDKPTTGSIILDGKDITKLPPNERPINTVFQKYALFPHLNVYDNIAFGLKLKGLSKEEMKKKVSDALEVVDLEGFEKRNISTLSGGQQQRIAIARAIVNEPQVLLLDEPLSALDYKMRKEMQLELKSMHKQLGITFIFVTHDQEEALTMSDKIVVMSNGHIQQVGTPEEIYNEPANVFVADFIGESNIFNGTMADFRKARFADAIFDCVDDFEKGTKIDAVIRPEDVEVVEPGKGQINGSVTSADFKGTFYITFVQCGQYEMEVHCLKQFKEGQEVGLYVQPDNIHIIPYDNTINHFEGVLGGITGGLLHVEFADIKWDIDPLAVYPDAVVSDDHISDKSGNVIETEGVKVMAYIPPEEFAMSDDVNEGDASGQIVSFYYIGDHYSYTIRSKAEFDYIADDEYLWNQDDIVSVKADPSKAVFKIIK